MYRFCDPSKKKEEEDTKVKTKSVSQSVIKRGAIKSKSNWKDGVAITVAFLKLTPTQACSEKSGTKSPFPHPNGYKKTNVRCNEQVSPLSDFLKSSI